MLIRSIHEPLLVLISSPLALIASIAAVPALALAFGWVHRRLSGTDPGPAFAGALPLGLAVVVGLLGVLLFGSGDVGGVLLGGPVGLAALSLVAVGGAMFASPSSRAALRASLGRGPATLAPAARAGFGIALLVGVAALGLGLRTLAAATRGPIALPGGLTMHLMLSEVLPFIPWAVGHAAMVGGAFGLLRARYAGTLLYSAGFVLVLLFRDWSYLALGAARSAELAFGLATMALAWSLVRPAPPPAGPR